MKKAFLLFIICFPLCMSAQLSEAFKEMINDDKKTFEKYEDLIFKSTTYIFSHPVDRSSKEFITATQIVGYWMNQDTGWGVPINSEFYKVLTNNDKQQFLYTVAMIHYQLQEKRTNSRELRCIPIKGEPYKDRADVKEVQLGGAKILLAYIGEDNNVTVNKEAEKYLEAYKKGKLEKLLFP